MSYLDEFKGRVDCGEDKREALDKILKEISMEITKLEVQREVVLNQFIDMIGGEHDEQ